MTVTTKTGASAIWDMVAAEHATEEKLRCLMTVEKKLHSPERCWEIATCIARIPIPAIWTNPKTMAWIPCCELHAEQVDAAQKTGLLK